VKSALEFGMQTAPGHRHGANEDALGSDPERQLWLVADGMGGHSAGDVAGVIVRDKVLEQVEGGADLAAAIDAAHAAVLEAASADDAKHGMGSTVVAAQIIDGQAAIGWVGDSRAYLLRSGTLRCLTRDHSLVQWLLEQQQITAEEAASHPDRNVLVRTLGFEHPSADLTSVDLQPDDTLLLCSDGLTGVLSEVDIRRILLDAENPQAGADALIEAVVERRGRDDASAIVIRNHARGTLFAELWLPVSGGVGLGLLAYLIWNWVKAS
jgi:protein phosphatase